MEKKTILLVEDSAMIREAIKQTLEGDHGYTVLEYPDGATAIMKLDAGKHDIDAAVLDIMMKGHGGSVRKYLVNTPRYKDKPVIYHTSLSKEQFDNRILEGAHYVQKAPDSIARIAEILKKLLG